MTWFVDFDYESYETAREEFAWDLPDDYNAAHDLVGKHDGDGVALYQQYPDGSEETYTFAEMDRLSDRVAAGLADRGVERGDRVGVVVPQKPANPLVHLACWKLGAVSLPLSVLFGPDALEYRLQDSGASVAVVDTSVHDAVAVEVTNFGNAPVREAVVVPAADDRRLPRQYVGTLEPGESATVEVNLDSVRSPANVTARVDYQTGSETGSAVGAYDYRPPEGAIRLTGVSLSLDGETLTLSGNAGNVGTGEVTGVVVAVGESEHVRPAYPQRTYFIGTVAGSEFAPFELTADIDAANASTVPVEVTYRSDGIERTTTVELPFERDAVADDAEGATTNTAVVVGFGVGLALLVVGIAVITRRYR
ncbi:AMP-binding protein [Halorarius halobius]|uniref:AMP-binding protein n=1 Tax=Halorarius halobius TaxID=2962671 RepID=UPI0020CCDA51|nr:AMP-binding protein [Halorarius halobius]